jgi:hypothetical protein
MARTLAKQYRKGTTNAREDMVFSRTMGGGEMKTYQGRIDWSGLYVWLGTNGVRRGLALISLVTMWDIMMFGWRGFLQYSIGYKGIALIWLGIALIFKGRRIEQNRG